MSELFSVEDLRQRSDDNELDLSLMQVSIVPVHQIASLRKITSIDLSCNLIFRLPNDFCSVLQHLIKLDLSKNKITELPKNIGMLQHLQRLDLFQNQLTLIPTGFSQLNKLKWLDLKDNPLDPNLTKIVGNCLDDKQCKQCAKKVVTAMKTLIETQERQRRKQIEEKKKQEALKREEERKQLEQKKKKQLAKERKRKNKQAKLKEAKEDTEDFPTSNGTVVDTKQTSKKGHSYQSWLSTLLVLLFAIGIGLCFYCNQHEGDLAYCRDINRYSRIGFDFLEKVILMIKIYMSQAADYIHRLVKG